MLKILYWQAPTILNSHLSQGTKDYDAGRLVLEPLARRAPMAPVHCSHEIPTKQRRVSKDLKSVTWKLKSGGSDAGFTPTTSSLPKYMHDEATAANSAKVGRRSVTLGDPTVVVT
jgi:peptide/nickel transport system substrate-binding protein